MGRKKNAKAAKKLVKAPQKRQQKQSLKAQLLSQNEYAQSLCNPFMTRGVKIPDLVSFPTSTFSVVQRLQGTVTAGGVFAVRWENTPYFELQEFGAAAGSNIIQNQGLWYSNTDASTVSLFGAGGAYAMQGAVDQLEGSGLFTPMAFADDISNVISSARCVSAGLLMEYTGTALNNQGVFTSAFIPAEKIFELYSTAGNAWGTFSMQIDSLQAEYHSSTTPVNSGSCAVTYHPLSQPANGFADTYAGGVFSGSGVNQWAGQGALPLAYLKYGQGSSNDWNLNDNNVANIERINYSHVLVLAGTGMTPGATVQVTLVANFEGIPYTNQLSFADSAPSPIDSLKMDQALRAVPEPLVGHGDAMVKMTAARNPVGETVAPVSQPQVQQPGSYVTEKIPTGGHTPQHANTGKSFMDTIVDALPTVAKYAKPVAEGLMALL